MEVMNVNYILFKENCKRSWKRPQISTGYDFDSRDICDQSVLKAISAAKEIKKINSS